MLGLKLIHVGKKGHREQTISKTWKIPRACIYGMGKLGGTNDYVKTSSIYTSTKHHKNYIHGSRPFRGFGHIYHITKCSFNRGPFNIGDPPETHLKPKSRKISFAYNLFHNHPTVLRFCTELDFARFEFNIGLEGISYIAQLSWFLGNHVISRRPGN